MATTNFLIEAELNAPSNVIPLWPVGGTPRQHRARPGQARKAQVHVIDADVLEPEAAAQGLARRVERVLCALLYHTQLEQAHARASKPLSIETRGERLVSRDRLMAVARAALNHGLTADLTRLAAAAITFEVQFQSRWRNRLWRLFSAQRRQINADTVAVARLLAWDLAELKLRPIDQFARYL
ncbi:hypothetical protein [Dyella flagellata]|uniref:Uncharacterized protein n=1 Tax=Dyella flagellata TaxID=1867833 RepID=A0ABQ5XDR7_9GAMM|nr:hypothetical protein [Dyella flagellata]GLQ89789.1 hypothetical protein GCM10007898_33640 [Dyella flagellata]